MHASTNCSLRYLLACPRMPATCLPHAHHMPCPRWPPHLGAAAGLSGGPAGPGLYGCTRPDTDLRPLRALPCAQQPPPHVHTPVHALAASCALPHSPHQRFAAHPHGICALSAFINLGTHATGFDRLFPGEAPERGRGCFQMPAGAASALLAAHSAAWPRRLALAKPLPAPCLTPRHYTHFTRCPQALPRSLAPWPQTSRPPSHASSSCSRACAHAVPPAAAACCAGQAVLFCWCLAAPQRR